MSGSIGGNRISHKLVNKTCLYYLDKVLKDFEGFEDFAVTGSYHARPKEDYGDIDLVVCINSKEDLKDIKKRFKSYIESLPDEICPLFRKGKNQGKKAQLYGNIVTCQIPIQGKETDYVQVDNIIVKSLEELEFVRNFLDIDAQIQTLLTATIRVIPSIIKYQDIAYFRYHLNDYFEVPELKENQEFEFVLSMFKVSLRVVTLDDNYKEINRETIWETSKWEIANILIQESLSKFRDFNFKNYTFEELLDMTKESYKDDERARRRICGIMKSMINIGPGEIGTEKGIKKQEAIDLAYKILEVDK
jgi:hypothetical protein